MKMVINECHGGFYLSNEAAQWMLAKNPCIELPGDGDWRQIDDRSDPTLIECVESLGEKANGCCAYLKIVEIPDDYTDISFDENDGYESVVYVKDGKMHRALSAEEMEFAKKYTEQIRS